MIRSSWQWQDQPNVDSLIYIFQLHGGDNEGQAPNIGLRIRNFQWTLNVCGDSAFHSTDITCSYYNLGVPVPGEWVDWVISFRLSHSISGKGSVQVWRNNALVVQASNLLTAYNDNNPPYIKIGTYIVNWRMGYRLGFNEIGVDYHTLKFADSESSYSDVYTGSGQNCGSPCDSIIVGTSLSPSFFPTRIPSSNIVSSVSSSSSSFIQDNLIWVVIIAMILGAFIIATTFYFLYHYLNQDVNKIEAIKSNLPTKSLTINTFPTEKESSTKKKNLASVAPLYTTSWDDIECVIKESIITVKKSERGSQLSVASLYPSTDEYDLTQHDTSAKSMSLYNAKLNNSGSRHGSSNNLSLSRSESIEYSNSNQQNKELLSDPLDVIQLSLKCDSAEGYFTTCDHRNSYSEDDNKQYKINSVSFARESNDIDFPLNI